MPRGKAALVPGTSSELSLFEGMELPPAPERDLPPAPFLKWVGGKRQLLPAILAGAPAQFSAYAEAFVGGGAVFFALETPGHACDLSDVNAELVNAYQVVRDDPEGLLEALAPMESLRTREDYEAIRAEVPADPVGRAARVVYLNRSCFNGLWRENASGEFNVPWGGERRDPVYNPPLIRAASRRLAGARVHHADFTKLCEESTAGTWLYLDPPYIPLSDTAAFASYSKAGFGRDEHERLAAAIARATERGVFVMLSNSDTPLTREIYAGLSLHSVSARRSVGVHHHQENSVLEVLGVNYPTSEMRDPRTFARAVDQTPPPETLLLFDDPAGSPGSSL